MLVNATRSSGKAFEVSDPETNQKHVINATRMLPIPPDSWRVDKQHLGQVMRDLAAFYQKRADHEEEVTDILIPHCVRTTARKPRTNREGAQQDNAMQHTTNRDAKTGAEPPLPCAIVPTIDVDRTTVTSEPDRTIVSADSRPAQLHISEGIEADDHMAIGPLTLEEMAITDGRVAERDPVLRIGLGEQLPTPVHTPVTEIQYEYERMDRERHTLIHGDVVETTPATAAVEQTTPAAEDSTLGTYPSTSLSMEVPSPTRSRRGSRRRTPVPPPPTQQEPSRRFTRSQLGRDLDDGRDVLHFFGE